MGTSGQRGRGDRLGQMDDEVRSAIRFAGVATLLGIGFLIVAALVVGGCEAENTSGTCSTGARAVFGLGAPAILVLSGLYAFFRTYRVWRAEGTWWGWQGAGWFLMMVMLVALMGVSPMVGPALGI